MRPPAPAHSAVGPPLLRGSSPAHSRPTILLAGLCRVEKLLFYQANSMGRFGHLTGQTSKKQVDRQGHTKRDRL